MKTISNDQPEKAFEAMWPYLNETMEQIRTAFDQLAKIISESIDQLTTIYQGIIVEYEAEHGKGSWQKLLDAYCEKSEGDNVLADNDNNSQM